ncbi:MAG: hypothetical protein ACT4OM_13580 [Actinomycetota bacterium]
MKQDRTHLIRTGYLLATIVLGFAAYAGGSALVRDRTGVSAEAGEEPAAPVRFENFEDDIAGISLSIPEEWRLLEDNSGDPLANVVQDDPSHVRLVAGPTSSDPQLLVRVKPLDSELLLPADFTTEDLGVIQGRLDQLIEGPDVRVAEKRPTNVKGLLAWRYLYNFKDQATGREGSHVHYFIFDGAKINVLVFQALPADALAGLAPTFDRILESFESRTRAVPRPVVSLPPAPASEGLTP